MKPQDNSLNQQDFTQLFRLSAPYIHANRSKTAIILINGLSMEQPTGLLHDIALLNSLGMKIVIVFGLHDDLLRNQHPITPCVNAQQLEKLIGIAGKKLAQLQAAFSMGLVNSPMHGAYVPVVSGNFVTARPLGIINGIDHQFCGKVRRTNHQAISSLANEGNVVLASPIATSLTGENFYISPWHLACEIAKDIKADKLLIVGESQAITENVGHELSYQSAQDLFDKMHSKDPGFAELYCALEAGKQIDRSYLLNADIDGQILKELFTRDGVGTLVHNNNYDVIRQANIDDVAGILELLMPLEEQGILVRRSRKKLEKEIQYFQIFERDGMIIGCAALYPFGNLAELGCVAIHQNYQHNQRGQTLLNQIESKARQLNIEQLFLLTTQSAHWFIEHGFSEQNIEFLPKEKQSLYNYQRNSKVFSKKL